MTCTTDSFCFPNSSGSRHNVGRVGDGGEHVKDAVYVGAVGARFERKDPEARMEWQEILVTSEQNTLGMLPQYTFWNVYESDH